MNAPPGVTSGGEDDDEPDETEMAKLDQLPFYGSWLNSRNKKGALIYLTYASKWIDYFETHDCHIDTHGVSLWVRVAEWLTVNLKTKDSLVGYLRDLLVAFLRSEGIIKMEREDVRNLGRYFRERMRIGGDDNLLETAEGFLIEALKETRSKVSSLSLSWGATPKYDWGYLQISAIVSKVPWIWLSCGFTSGKSPWFSGGSAAQLYGLVAVCTDDQDIAESLSAKLGNWTEEEDGGDTLWWHVNCAAEEFLGQATEFTRAFARWAKQEIEEAKHLVDRAVTTKINDTKKEASKK